ncbi:KOW domain-containing RNA-binding protein [Clostridium swellfunianum]|uniref:KOW domain-containing RNA-binding protein n=1 Tax=Clostridium swellfunianum TaxID=1367462 RepID=UPI00202E90C8|nr:KOW domain-containing RNA-binding protein [Clostridium swellfunianum]
MSTDYIGRVVLSKSGRDEGRYFVIVDIINENYVYISDGDLRRLQKPKKKKIKHLIFTKHTSENIKNLLQEGDKVNNNAIRKYLQSMNSNEEV